MKKQNSTSHAPSRALLPALAALASAALVSLAPSLAAAQEPASCLSPNPSDWPASSKPYFMIGADTSSSMDANVGNPAIASTCGFGTDRRAHLRCALRNMFLAYSGQVNFGLATFPRAQTGCGNQCFTGFDGGGTCQYNNYPGNNGSNGCGPGSGATRRGMFIRVPMLQDSFWSNPPPTDNTSSLLGWVDNSCSLNAEIFADGFTPLNGMLRDMKRYFSATGWTAQDNSVTYATPLAAQDLTGTGVNGSTGCRSVNVILITDGDETCDTNADVFAAAQDLYQNGVVVGGRTYKVRVFVINFAGGTVTTTNQIASNGGTGTSVLANNETDLSIALSNIIAGSVQTESCDNLDNNCNGCTDEGFTHYCNVQQTCCSWGTALERTQCLASYTGSITPQDPDGNLTLLPCTTVPEQAQPQSWLCFDPKETCDSVDNNCQAGVDENVLKCGDPAHCPQTEVCDAQDNDCDGQTDEGCGGCVASTEICDGCDNDCDGQVDEEIDSLPCGLASPPNCVGQLVCAEKSNPGGVVGACVGGGFNQCSNNPQTEACDGVDNDCDGIPDDGVAPAPCVPAGQPPGLVFGGDSQCQQGTQACGSLQCVGFVGPSAEVCDGVDNDCDGVVDDNVFGVGLNCGLNQAPCSPGLTACVNGSLVCQGGTGPQPEVCDGVDNNCNGVVDDPPLADGPQAGQNGCWTLPGDCCTFANLEWCFPPGASCTDVGALSPPCNKGTLACAGASGWICQGSKGPASETCDGLDNDCDGAVDEVPLPDVGGVCGSDTGECQTGLVACNSGVLDCVGDVPPASEVCDGLDNDCDGTNDNGIPLGGACTPDYDPAQFPNPPVFPPCQPGTLACDGAGNIVCDGGTGPTAELCNGVDDDCDGEVDEPGAAPNGIDGSADPGDPTIVIGEACGNSVGECSGGVYACVNGVILCQGGQAPQPEECDCQDNDCDGSVDNPPSGESLCSAGKDCVASAVGCMCAEKCGNGEIPCPGGQTCLQGTVNGQPGNYCFPDPCPDDCINKVVTDVGTGAVECAPAGTPGGSDCIAPPVCVCKGESGCHEPCFGVVCTDGLVCTGYGAAAGTCVVDNCYQVPCQGCDTACHSGSCIDNPCEPNPCKPTQVCKPSADFTSQTCIGSCAEVTCEAGQACEDGECKPTCETCDVGQVCDTAANPPVCVESKCPEELCSDGSYCDPLTGECGDFPCSGVVCPSDQECKLGDCFIKGSGGAGGSGGSGGSTNTNPASGGSGGSGGGVDANKAWGLATGGGGCACRIGTDDNDARNALALGALALALTAARRRRRARP